MEIGLVNYVKCATIQWTLKLRPHCFVTFGQKIISGLNSEVVLILGWSKVGGFHFIVIPFQTVFVGHYTTVPSTGSAGNPSVPSATIHQHWRCPHTHGGRPWNGPKIKVGCMNSALTTPFSCWQKELKSCIGKTWILCCDKDAYHKYTQQDFTEHFVKLKPQFTYHTYSIKCSVPSERNVSNSRPLGL